MTEKELIKLANNRAVEFVRSCTQINIQERKYLAELPEKQAIKQLSTLFLIAATYNAAKAPC